MKQLPEGVRHLPGLLDAAAQTALVEEIRQIVVEAPLYTPAMPRTGKEMTVRMTNCGTLGWVTDKERGYRYQETHPVTGKVWPAIPARLLSLWEEVVGWPQPPEACLINFYDASARMGLHQDRDEQNLEAPVLSVSLGDACLFRVGGTERGGGTMSFRLESGDVVLLEGPGRLRFHGVDRIYAGTSDLLKNGGRINLTLRRVS
ncbi:MAG: alpha-ketoglutarate-dependent dioxygenase AlkB [Mesorhizobium sp.]|nr:alpha-ketoglutarate-dependent dioxygenase AlkB [Mesorhizobium sp.]